MALHEMYYGTKDENGAILTWPAVTLAGRDYVRPITSIMISKRRFVVVENSREFQLLEAREREGEGPHRPAEVIYEEIKNPPPPKPAAQPVSNPLTSTPPPGDSVTTLEKAEAKAESKK